MNLITAYIPVRNGERWISSAIDSMLQQSISCVDIFIYNDGSDDGTKKILDLYMNKYPTKISVFNSETSMGPAYASNYMIDKIVSPYSARLDADDFSHYDRLHTQYLFLVKNKLDYCGSFVNEFGSKSKIRKYSTEKKLEKFIVASNTPFAHSSLFCKTSVLKRYKYNETLRFCDDYELFYRLALSEFKGSVIPLPLVNYRLHDSQISQKNKLDQIIEAMKVRKIYFPIISNLDSEKIQNKLTYYSLAEVLKIIKDGVKYNSSEFILLIQSILSYYRQLFLYKFFCKR